MAGDNQHFCLRWNNHQSTLISVFDTLLESGTLVDCTLAAEGQFLKAHKVVLCACSPYLEVLLSQHYEKHPIVILKDIKFQELKSMMDYMYRGEVNISQDQLSTFLKAAESLQIKGLTDGGGNEDGAASSSAPAKAPIATPVRKPVQQAVPRPTAAAAQGLTIERRPESPHIRSRDDSASPTPRKRRRNQRRPSTSDDPDSHIDTSNSCDVPPLQSGALSGVGVPNIPATITKGAPLDDGDHETENSRVNNHDASADGVAGPKIEPTGELIEPKTEYLEEMNNEDSIEDLTLDDDDDMDNSMDMSRAGPSHDNSNQSFGQWPMSANQTDEVFMNAQEAVGAHRDTQVDERWLCPNCGRNYKRKAHLSFHLAKECGVGPQYRCAKCFKPFKRSSHLKSHQLSCGNVPPRFQCDICMKRFTRKDNMKTHRNTIHRRPADSGVPNEVYSFYSEWHIGDSNN